MKNFQALLLPLSVALVLFEIVALALIAAAHAKIDANNAIDGGIDLSDPSVSFFIFASVSTVLVAFIQLSLQCSKDSRRAASAAVACSCYGVIVWIAAVGALGGRESDIFHISTYCGANADYTFYGYECLIWRLLLASWVFGLLALVLWLASLIAASIGLCSSPRVQSKNAYPSSQPMQPMHGQPQAPNYMPPNGNGPAFNQYQPSGPAQYNQPHNQTGNPATYLPQIKAAPV